MLFSSGPEHTLTYSKYKGIGAQPGAKEGPGGPCHCHRFSVNKCPGFRAGPQQNPPGPLACPFGLGGKLKDITIVWTDYMKYRLNQLHYSKSVEALATAEFVVGQGENVNAIGNIPATYSLAPSIASRISCTRSFQFLRGMDSFLQNTAFHCLVKCIRCDKINRSTQNI